MLVDGGAELLVRHCPRELYRENWLSTKTACNRLHADDIIRLIRLSRENHVDEMSLKISHLQRLRIAAPDDILGDREGRLATTPLE
jgi:hypothetical protein